MELAVPLQLGVSELANALRQRFGPLIEGQRRRVSFAADKEGKARATIQPWELIRVIRGFDENENELVAWLHAAAAHLLQPIICGYDDLLAGVERRDAEAAFVARRILGAELRVALSVICERWMYQMLDRRESSHLNEQRMPKVIKPANDLSKYDPI